MLRLIADAKDAHSDPGRRSGPSSGEAALDVAPSDLSSSDGRRGAALGKAAMPPTGELQPDLPSPMRAHVFPSRRGRHVPIEAEPSRQLVPAYLTGADLVQGIFLGVDLQQRGAAGRLCREERVNVRDLNRPLPSPDLERRIRGIELGAVNLTILQEYLDTLAWTAEVMIEQQH